MVTEEAEFTLMHELPHQAHPLALGAKGLESMVLYFSMMIYISTTITRVNSD